MTTDKKTHYINGEWLSGSGALLESTNPINNKLIWAGQEATADEVTLAYEAAKAALPRWSLLEIEKRSSYLRAFAQLISKKKNELAYLISLETGKPLWESLTEAQTVSAKIELSIQAYQERNAEKKIPTTEADACLRFKPHGVVAVLGAYNFPAHLSNGHLVPALLAGNTAVYKPSELAPAVAQFIMECWHASGLPQGVINCIQGGSETGKALLNTAIQAVYFTGSYRTGKYIHQQFSQRPDILLALEMGGNNPLVVHEVKNITAAVYQSLLSTMITSGQRCSCARRLLIADNPTGDDFLNRFINACRKIKIGAFTEQPEPFMGPVINYSQALLHLKAQQKLIDVGGLSLLKMSLMAERSALLSPGIIDMTKVNDVPDEEIFAPFVQIYRYQDFEEALELANNTRYGLVAGLLSDSKPHYEQFYEKLRAGLINWNRPTTGASGSLPFGGVGLSGNHRPSAYFASDYCSYPIASLEQPLLTQPALLLPGINLE